MIEISNLTKVFGSGDDAVTVLDGIDVDVRAGEIHAVVGPSGAGKSTLAQCINLLQRPTSGEVIVNGENLTRLDDAGLRKARRRIGTVFQSANLLSRRTAAQNVALPLEYFGVTKAQTRSRVAELLDQVGLAGYADRYPHQLSGGQRQRVGIARALALRPPVLLADEATAGLDPIATESFLRLLTTIRDQLDLAVVFITHEMDTIVQVADKVGRLDHGHIVESGRVIDLLLDPGSALGRDLRPRGTSAAAARGDTTIELIYRSADVPGDWISRLSTRLGSGISILSANVSAVGGVSVGSATVGVGAAGVDAFLDAAAGLGLAGQVIADVDDRVAA